MKRELKSKAFHYLFSIAELNILKFAIAQYCSEADSIRSVLLGVGLQ